jgi:hypothetical protein
MIVEIGTHMKNEQGDLHYLWFNDSISISPGISGTNRWSVNVTDIAIKNLSGYPCPCHQVYSSDELRRCSSCNIWIVFIIDHRDGADKIYYDFVNWELTLIPATNITPSNVPQTTIQNPSLIQSTTSQTIVPITTQSSSLPFTLSIVVFVVIALLRHIYNKKSD